MNPLPSVAVDERVIVRVLAEIAETASETLELQQVFERLAASIRQVIPLDNMGVVRIVGDDRAVLHAATFHHDKDCPDSCGEPWPLTMWSPRIRPRPEPIPRVEDAEAELDPAFPVDADIVGGGVRSSMWEPFPCRDGGFTGGVWVSANQPRAFTAEHQEILRPIAKLLGSAVEHWRIWDAERRRRERLDRLEHLLRDLVAEALDVRDIFTRISQAVQPVLPHDALVLTQLMEDDSTARLVAIAGELDVELPSDPIDMSEKDIASRAQDYEILRDIPEELAPDTERNRLVLASGMRSWLGVPVMLAGEYQGSLKFMHREPGRFDEGDVEVARRLADRIALALSHHRLAEEERTAAEERERAAQLEAAVETLTQELESRHRLRIVGTSRSWREVLRQVSRVAGVDTTVLITGESGTGKEIVSQLIHEGSARSEEPFVAINCAALPEQLLESELFGHERGAFTGAMNAKAGRIEQAAGGTLFLDEVGEMSPMVQAKLLRVLQEREFQRLGGTRTLKANVRVITATNRDLMAAIGRGQFREDLYYRLNVFEIVVPPLRERPEDILLLAESFLDELGTTMGRPAAGISRDARDWLLAYPWPGNVRELRNAIERAILLCDGGLIARDHLPAVVGRPEEVRVASNNGSFDADAPLPPGGIDLEDVERAYVEKALEQTRGNKSKASRLLGLTRAQLYSRLDKYGLR